MMETDAEDSRDPVHARRGGKPEETARTGTRDGAAEDRGAAGDALPLRWGRLSGSPRLVTLN